MEILLLGTGEAFAKTLYQTNFLVTPAEGAPFLVDCGHTASRALHRRGIPLRAVSDVVLSHLHGDHVGGLEELGFATYFGGAERPRLWAGAGLLDYLWDHALKAGMGQRLRDDAGAFFDATLPTYFDVRPVGPRESFSLGSATVTPFRTPHTPGRPCWGFRLDERATGHSALLTCDSRFHRRNLEEFGAGVDVVFHDCQLVSSPGHIHATLEELLTLPQPWQEKLVLVHYSDNWREFEGRIGAMRFGEEGISHRF